jgi:hypothetical protein
MSVARIVPTVAADVPRMNVFMRASFVWLNSKNTNFQCSSEKLPTSGPDQFLTNAVRSRTP